MAQIRVLPLEEINSFVLKITYLAVQFFERVVTVVFDHVREKRANIPQVTHLVDLSS